MTLLLLDTQPHSPDRLLVTHTPRSHLPGCVSGALQPTSPFSSFCQTPRPIPSLSDLSGAADSLNHFPSSLSYLLLAGLTEKKKKSFARLTLTTKDMFFCPFLHIIFSISIGSICCSYNSLQLNIRGGRGVGGGGNIDRTYIKNIGSFQHKNKSLYYFP